MLNYRHSFHAGNFADVLKHIILIDILEHITKKEKAFDYIDTHAGAGLFSLESSQAKQLEEYRNGIGKLKLNCKKITTSNTTSVKKQLQWPELERYFSIIDKHNPNAALVYYPGSPMIAMDFLRPQDHAWLYELHPTDFDLLEANLHDRRVKHHCKDGFKGLLSVLPPLSRRGLVLIDPSYESRDDYEQVVTTIKSAYKKFATGTYAIWYPVVDRQLVQRLEKKLIHSGIKNIQRFELGLEPDSTESNSTQQRMTASGMIIINPPWGLLDNMSSLLPKLAAALGDGNTAFAKCDTLVPE